MQECKLELIEPKKAQCTKCKKKIAIPEGVDLSTIISHCKKTSFIKKIKKYGTAVKKWVDAGKPLRTDEEIVRIYDEICVPCEHFKEDSCGLCGCRLKRDVANATNKIAMATEECPINKWGPVTDESKIRITPEAPVPPVPDTPKKGGCGCGG